MRLLALVALAGCYRPADVASCAISCDEAHACPSGLDCDGTLCHAAGTTCGGGGDDAGGDAATFCFTPRLLAQICVPVRPAYVGPTFLDTSDAQACDATVARGPLSDLCVIAAEQVSITAYMKVNGSRSFVLIGTQGIAVSGTIDVTSYVGQSPGAGGTKKCNTAAAGTASNGGHPGGGGGAAGSWGTLGGKGGSNGFTTMGGSPSSLAGTDVFDAGQNGGVGGNAMSQLGGGACGIGGGAVYLYSPSSISISGHVLAFASAGGGATDFTAGGGGGGAGGMIVIDGVTLVSSSTTVLGATGAGGGAGANTASGGDSGMPPMFTTVAAPAQGGAMPVPGGNGATGPAQMGAMEATPGLNGVNTGGGGGGGGAGVIVVPLGTSSPGTIYPPAS